MFEKVIRGTTWRMGCVFVDGFGVGKDDLTPVVRCYRLSDAKFLKNDDTWPGIVTGKQIGRAHV